MSLPTFSEILTAVKPKDRSDRYKVLAALFCLSAHKSPVTTTEVADLLKLHLGRLIPKNVTDRLRKYSADVEAAEKGPPLKWRLTAKGVENLRLLSGLALQEGTTAADFGVDVGIVCALESEFEAVIAAAGGSTRWDEVSNPGVPHRYRQTSLVTHQGRTLRTIGTTSMSMGLTSAAIVTTQLIMLYRPRLVVMAGIAAGTRSSNKQFGDILVADPSVDYNSGKVVDEGGIREFLPDPYPIGLRPRIRSLLQKYSGTSPSALATIRDKWLGESPIAANRVHLGPLGAADQVIDDPKRVLEIQKNWRKLVGVEMETYGVYRACHDAPDPKPGFVSFKAVCDFAAAKTDSWQAFAAYMAAEFSIHFLRHEWEAMWPDLTPRSANG